MRIFRGQEAQTEERTPNNATAASAVTIGNFDGLHIGHQAMLSRLLAVSKERKLQSSVLTFEPHPRDYFAQVSGRFDSAPARITTLRDKLGFLFHFGIDQVMVLPFRKSLAALSPRAFVEEVLLRQLNARYILVGDDFHFGSKRAGNFQTLLDWQSEYGFVVERMPSIALEGERVSSSGLRAVLAAGDMSAAERMLGRPYSISGHVVHGRKLGRKLGQSAEQAFGFSTLNLRFQHWQPAVSGIFAVQVHGLTEHGCLQGVANLGVRPSLDVDDVNGGRVLLETYCLNWPQHLGQDGAYGKIIRVDLLHKLHDERRYTSLASLQEGIAEDIDETRVFFATNHPDKPAV